MSILMLVLITMCWTQKQDDGSMNNEEDTNDQSVASNNNVATSDI